MHRTALYYEHAPITSLPQDLYIGIVTTDKMANAEEQYPLSQEQIDHFVQHGWIKLSNCFTREQAGDLQKNLWTRLGMDPEDISTW